MLFSSDPSVKDFLYMRLSVIALNIIEEHLNLTYKFVAPIFRTALLTALNSNDTSLTVNQDQNVVDCYEVQRYTIFILMYIILLYNCHSLYVHGSHNRRDIDNHSGWARLECTSGFSDESKRSLLQNQLIDVTDIFTDELPVINGSSLVIAGQFNFSSI